MPVDITTENSQIIKTLKNVLQTQKLLDKSQKIAKIGTQFHIVSLGSLDETTTLLENYKDEISLSEIEKNNEIIDTSLAGLVAQYLRQHLVEDTEGTIDQLLEKLPKKWSVYPPMVLFNTGSFDSDVWKFAFQSQIDKNDFFESIVKFFPVNITHLAINKPIIEEDAMRRPFNLVPLWGEFGPEPTLELFSNPTSDDLKNAFWCTVVQNGITQTWAPRYTMFSRGNIKEKKRVLDTFKNVKGKSVLDLYAGIGYFTLSYLAQGATVFCWEINPWSIQGLVRGLEKNKHQYRLFSGGAVASRAEIQEDMKQGVKAFVFHEYNEFAPSRLTEFGLTDITHVNLGLLPSLKPSWAMARDASFSSTENTMVHVHENVHKDKFSNLTTEIETFFQGHVTHLEKVKTFAPDVWHVVVDVVPSTQRQK